MSKWRDAIDDPRVSARMVALVIDKAHCVSKWYVVSRIILVIIVPLLVLTSETFYISIKRALSWPPVQRTTPE